MTTAKTLKTLRKAFADFEAAYVGIETVYRESEAISSIQADAMKWSMRSAHFWLRQMLAEVEREAKERGEPA
jgi:hypothetical protein